MFQKQSILYNLQKKIANVYAAENICASVYCRKQSRLYTLHKKLAHIYASEKYALVYASKNNRIFIHCSRKQLRLYTLQKKLAPLWAGEKNCVDVYAAENSYTGTCIHCNKTTDQNLHLYMLSKNDSICTLRENFLRAQTLQNTKNCTFISCGNNLRHALVEKNEKIFNILRILLLSGCSLTCAHI